MSARIARLSILDSYGVRWARETFARDLLQNFFDSASDFRAIALDIRAGEGVVEIRGPATFDIDLLAYIGATTKTTGRSVGGFGEGFKICALIGARDFGLTITAGSGPQEIAVFFDPVPLGRELCYRVTTREEAPIQGSYVRLEGCDAACIAAFQAAPAMFRHPDNPRLRDPFVVDLEQGVAVYLAPDGGEGELYYRRQLRGRAQFYASSGGRPVTLAHDGVIDALEGDRDRRDLPAEPVARAIGEKLGPDDLYRVLIQLMPYWKSGNDVLSGLLGAGSARQLRFAWPPRWLARSAKSRGLCEFAERQGYSIALASFAELGMPTPEEHYTSLETRPASPLERSRFRVVADLYRDLNGKEARTTKLEVFDVAGAAVSGQHLGDKIIVGAELFARGFDAVSGTILHELAHETGGEEDIRFLRRLTNLLGAAVREPEKIRASRRRYAAARPAKEAPSEEKTQSGGAGPANAYTPEYDGGPDDYDGVGCALVVPPGFPPSEKLVAAIRAAAAETGIGVHLTQLYVSGPVGAVSWRVPGVPSVLIAGRDPDPPPGDRAALGYRLRTYGPDGRGLCPDPESLRAALRQAKENGLTGRAGNGMHRVVHEGYRERVRALLGIELPPPAKPSARQQRDEVLRAWLKEFIGEEGGFSIEDAWVHGQEAAAAAWMRAARKDRRSAETLFDEISDRLNLAITHAGELEDADPDYDDADAFERDAMLAAQGAAVSCYAEGADEADAKVRAEAGFRAVRAATTRVLDLDVAQQAKPVILTHAMKGAGLGWLAIPRTRSFDAEGFRQALEHAEAEALRLQRRIDDEGGYYSSHELSQALDGLCEDPGFARLAARNARVWQKRVRATYAIRAAYERALAESGSELDAAARCLEEAARLQPEALR